MFPIFGELIEPPVKYAADIWYYIMPVGANIAVTLSPAGRPGGGYSLKGLTEPPARIDGLPTQKKYVAVYSRVSTTDGDQDAACQ